LSGSSGCVEALDDWSQGLAVHCFSFGTCVLSRWICALCEFSKLSRWLLSCIIIVTFLAVHHFLRTFDTIATVWFPFSSVVYAFLSEVLRNKSIEETWLSNSSMLRLRLSFQISFFLRWIIQKLLWALLKFNHSIYFEIHRLINTTIRLLNLEGSKSTSNLLFLFK